jgi:hypothetical protein
MTLAAWGLICLALYFPAELFRTTCQDCSLKSQCTIGPERQIPRWEHEHLLEAVSSDRFGMSVSCATSGHSACLGLLPCAML